MLLIKELHQNSADMNEGLLFISQKEQQATFDPSLPLRKGDIYFILARRNHYIGSSGQEAEVSFQTEEISPKTFCNLKKSKK